MTKRTFKEAVIIMVDWWVEKTFHTRLNQSNGAISTPDSLKADTFGLLVGNMLAQDIRDKTTPEQIEKFKEILIIELLTGDYTLASYNYHYSPRLAVDYNACKRLSKACKEAGINTRILPIKTDSYINTEDNSVWVSYGYGTPLNEIN